VIINGVHILEDMMAKKVNIKTLMKRVKSDDSYRKLDTIQDLWDNVLEAYRNNIGDDNIAWLVETAYDKTIEAEPNFSKGGTVQESYKRYRDDHVKVQYDELREGRLVKIKSRTDGGKTSTYKAGIRQLPGVISIADRLESETTVNVMRQVKLDIHSGDRELVHRVVERHILDSGIQPDRFKCIPEGKKTIIFDMLKNSYPALRTAVLPDYEEDKAVKEFDRIKKEGYELDGKFREDQKVEGYDVEWYSANVGSVLNELCEKVNRDHLARAEKKGKVDFGAVKEYDEFHDLLQLDKDFLESEPIVSLFYQIGGQIIAAINAFEKPADGETRKDVDAQKQDIRELGDKLDEIGITRESIDKAVKARRDKKLAGDYSDLSRRLEKHKKLLEEEGVLVGFNQRCKQAEDEIKKYKKKAAHQTTPNANIANMHIVNLNLIISQYFDDKKTLDDITRVAKRQGRPELIEKFQEKRKELLHYVLELEVNQIKASKGKESAMTTYAHYIAGFNRISDDLKASLHDPELQDMAGRYNSLVSSVSAMSLDPKHYEHALAGIAKIKAFFEGKRGSVGVDECIRRMEAISIGITANASRKIDVIVDSKKAKTDIEGLAAEADKYADIDQELPAFTRRAVDAVNRFVIYGIDEKLKERIGISKRIQQNEQYIETHKKDPAKKPEVDKRKKENEELRKLSTRITEHTTNLGYVTNSSNIHQYEYLLKRLIEGRTAFIEGGEKATGDEKAAIDECVKRIEAFTIRTGLEKAFNFDVYLDSNRTKGEVDELLRAAEDHKDLDGDLPVFAKDIHDKIYEIVILGPEEAARKRGLEGGDLAEFMKRIEQLKDVASKPAPKKTTPKAASVPAAGPTSGDKDRTPVQTPAVSPAPALAGRSGVSAAKSKILSRAEALIPKDPATVQAEADARLSAFLTTNPDPRTTVNAMECYIQELKSAGIDTTARESQIVNLKKEIGMEE
jgi:hypothetical protein